MSITAFYPGMAVLALCVVAWILRLSKVIRDLEAENERLRGYAAHLSRKKEEEL